MKKIVLASASERRNRILRDLGISFSSMSPGVEELIHDDDPRWTVIDNSLRKNEFCRRQYPQAFIIAADTIVVLKGRIVTKPLSMEEAFSFLRMLSGQTHQVFTGVAFSRPGFSPGVVVDISDVTFRTLTDAVIQEYIARVKPLDRAGAYDIDENGDLLVASYTGSRTNIMGLSSETVSRLLVSEGLL
jgi:septum formation protein